MESLRLCFAMFTRLPLPQPTWSERSLRYVLLWFPLVGLLLGLLFLGWAWISSKLPVPPLLRGAGFWLLPLLLTGGLHLDGYADVCDAQASCAEPAKKQEILRDPHCGAFAVIRLGIYLIASFALSCSLVPQGRGFFCLALGFVLSRMLSGLSLCSFPLAAESSMGASFALTEKRSMLTRVLLTLTLLLVAGLVYLGGLYGLAVSLAGLLCFLQYRRVAKRDFGGSSGDLAGWFLQRAELFMLLTVVCLQILGEYRA